MSLPTVFVCGATGTQGGAVARHLLAKGVPVHATVRDLTSAPATALSSQGAKLWRGSWTDEPALRAAMAGCTAAFLNFMPDLADLGAELRWATSILRIARDAGVSHVVYASSPVVREPEKLRHWDPDSFVARVLLSKQAIERATRASGVPTWTVLRPASFMANYLDPLVRMYGALVESGTWTTALRPDTLIPLVDTETIGAFAAAAILDPTRFAGQEVDIADEFLLPGQVFEKLSVVTGRDLKINYLSDEEVEAQKATNPFLGGQLLSRNMADFVDLDKIKTWGVSLGTLDAFLQREKARVEETWSKAS